MEKPQVAANKGGEDGEISLLCQPPLASRLLPAQESAASTSVCAARGGMRSCWTRAEVEECVAQAAAAVWSPRIGEGANDECGKNS